MVTTDTCSAPFGLTSAGFNTRAGPHGRPPGPGSPRVCTAHPPARASGQTRAVYHSTMPRAAAEPMTPGQAPWRTYRGPGLVGRCPPVRAEVWSRAPRTRDGAAPGASRRVFAVGPLAAAMHGDWLGSKLQPRVNTLASLDLDASPGLLLGPPRNGRPPQSDTRGWRGPKRARAASWRCSSSWCPTWPRGGAACARCFSGRSCRSPR